MTKEQQAYNLGLNQALDNCEDNPYDLWSEEWEEYRHGVDDAARLFADNFR